MNKLLLTITEELRAAINFVAEERGETVAATVEGLLRGNSAIKSAMSSLGLTWRDRTPVGPPKKADRDAVRSVKKASKKASRKKPTA
jgi:hypothetical protein